MSQPGDLLALLHGARQRWTTARLVVRRWYDLDRGRAAMERAAEQARARGSGVTRLRSSQARSSDAAADAPGTYESVSRLWLDPAGDRARVERTDEHGDFYSVRVGERWWSFHPKWGASSNEDDTSVRLGSADEVGPLLDPALLLGSLDFESVGERTAAGRATIVARATPRDLEEPHRQGHYLPGGADSFELVVDAERGVLLRLEARLDAAAFMVLELVEADFDEAFTDEIFVFRPPPGEQIRLHRDLYAPPEGVSIEEAARRAPFTVLAPKRIPDGWHLSTLYVRGQDRPPTPPGVVMHLRDPAGLHQLRIIQRADELEDSLNWVDVEFSGQHFLVWEPEGRLGGEIEAKLERHRTHLRLTGDLDRTTLLEIAHSLQPAPQEIALVDREPDA